MNPTTHVSLARRRHLPRFAAAVAAFATLGAASLALDVLPASAAFPATDYETAFEIDGNVAVDGVGGQDWSTPPASAPNIQTLPGETADGCSANGAAAEGTDADIMVPGTKLDDVNFSSLPTQPGTPLTKGDLCSVYEASELVFIPTADAGDDPSAGQYEFIFYGAWSRPDVQGEIDVFFPLLGSDPASNSDDLLIQYDFDDSTQTTTVLVNEWDAVNSEWDVRADPIVYEAVTTQGEVTNGAGDLTFGEFAINLTRSGILPADGPCVVFSAGDTVTETGNAETPTLKDVVDVPAIPITNCSTLEVQKVTTPAAPTDPQTFGYLVEQLDGKAVLSGGATSIDDDLTVPGQASDVHQVLISPDYVVTEDMLPAGWTEVRVTCTSEDPLTGATGPWVLYSTVDGEIVDTSFPVGPGTAAVCVIENVGPPEVSVTKTVQGAFPAGGVDFTISPLPSGETEATKTATEAEPTVSWTLDAGTEYTITEETLAGYVNGDITCDDDEDGDNVVSAGAGESVSCTVENIQLASVQVTKTVLGTWPANGVEFTISPVPTGETASKTATSGAPTVSWVGLDPSVEYTITESDIPGFVNGSVACGEGDNSFTPAPGENVTCSVTNSELGSVVVTKTVQGAFPAGGVDFTISPVPAGQDATKTATEGAPSVTWTGLTPGQEYTVTEESLPGYINGTIDCDGDNAFQPAPGDTVTCDVTNIELASVVATKTVQGAFPAGGVDFTIDPVPAGQDATKTATEGAPSVTWTGLTPGQTYTVTEEELPGYVNGAIDCDGDNAFQPAPGETVTCDVTNLELASVDVTKTVAPEGETGWSFDFTISPVPAGETATKSATSAAPTVGWDGLVPGTAYTVTEQNGTDLVTGTLTCTGGANGTGSSTFTPAPGDDVSCSITNTRITDIEVVKTSSPATVLPGGNVQWTIQVTNNGPSTALDVVLNDPIPTTLNLVSVNGPASWDCTGSTAGNPGTVRCTKPDMVPGETWTFQIETTVVAAAAPGTVTNVATVSTSSTETTTENNVDSAGVRIDEVAILPPTGSGLNDRLAISFGLLLAGGALLLLQRRRRPDAVVTTID
jgi:uncharacterized repeat protein (TIGR01451 family)